MIRVEFKMKSKAAGKAKQTVTIGAKKNNPPCRKVKPPSKESNRYFALLNDNCLDYFPTLGKILGSGRDWRKNISNTFVRLRTSMQNKLPLAFTGIVHKPSSPVPFERNEATCIHTSIVGVRIKEQTPVPLSCPLCWPSQRPGCKVHSKKSLPFTRNIHTLLKSHRALLGIWWEVVTENMEATGTSSTYNHNGGQNFCHYVMWFLNESPHSMIFFFFCHSH